MREFPVFMPLSSEYNTRGQLARRPFFEVLQNDMENKSEENENRIFLGDFNCTMNKMDRGGGNKTQKNYICGSKYTLSKLIVDNRLDDLWRRENPDSSESAHYNRSSVISSMVDRVYTNNKIANNTKNNHIIVSISDRYHANSFDKLPSKTRIGKD